MCILPIFFIVFSFVNHIHRKLPAAKLRALLEEIHAYFHNMLGFIRSEHVEIRTKIVESTVALGSESSETNQSGPVVQLAGDVGELLTGYLQCVVAYLLFILSLKDVDNNIARTS